MEPEKKSNGAFIGLAVIVIILVIGGIYMWNSSQNTASNTPGTPVQQYETVNNQDSADLNSLDQYSSSTDTATGVDANSVN